MRPALLAPALAALLLAACARPLPPPPSPEAAAGAQGFLSVVERLEPVAEAECARRNPKADCDFLVVVDDHPGLPPNAYQTLDRGGRPVLAVTLALVGEVRNEDEMAFVMAHEAAHHIAGHLGRQAENANLGAAILGELAGQAADATPASVRAARRVGAELGARRFSKEFELEADALGAQVAARAGFDPIRGSEFFLRIPDPGERFLGTHPSTAERLAAVRAAMAGL